MLAVGLRAGHAVGGAIHRCVGARFPSLGDGIELAAVNAEDASIATEPEAPEFIFLNPIDQIIKQALLRTKRKEAPALEPAQSVVRADPQRAVDIFVEDKHPIICEPVGGGEACYFRVTFLFPAPNTSGARAGFPVHGAGLPRSKPHGAVARLV